MVEEANFSRLHPLYIILSKIEKIGYSQSDVIVGTMPNLYEHVRNVLNFEKTVYCVPFGVTLDEVVSERIQRASNKLNIIYAGSIGITNGLNTFIEVIKDFDIKGERNIHFHIAGSGDLLGLYKRELSKCNNCTFYGRLDQQTLQNLISKCDVAYFSSVKSKAYDYGWSPNKLMLYLSLIHI